MKVVIGDEIQSTYQGEATCTRRMRKRGDNDEKEQGEPVIV